jgi:hypothetical protein
VSVEVSVEEEHVGVGDELCMAVSQTAQKGEKGAHCFDPFLGAAADIYAECAL